MAVSEQRVAELEVRTAQLEDRLARVESGRPGARSVPVAHAAHVRDADPERFRPLPVVPAPARQAREPRSVAPPAPAREQRLEDLLGGQVLGWVGGVAILVGLLFFLVIAASRGWLSEEVRAVMAAAASLALLATGAQLHERRGRAEAALAAAATGIAGLFATVVVAGPVYGLLPALIALTLALAVGAAATALALRWNAPGIGWLGILGALVSPALVGAAAGGTGIALMLVAYAAGGAILLWQRWHALAGATFLAAVAQLAWWFADGRPGSLAVVAALAVFGAVTAGGAAGFEWRARSPRLRPTAHVLLALNALALATLGAWELGGSSGHLWLAGLAVAHLAAGLLLRRSPHVTRELALAATALGIVLGDVAFAAVADGLPLVLGWAGGAVAFSALARRARRRADEAVVLTGLGGHLLLALATALTGAAPLSAVAGGGDDRALALAALAAIGTSAWAAALLLPSRYPRLRMVLDGLALGALAVFSAVALDGAALTVALAGEAAALAALAARERARDVAGVTAPAGAAPAPDAFPFGAALAFLGAALLQALFVLAQPTALVAGVDAVMPALVGLGAVVAATIVVARAAHDDEVRTALGAAAAVTGLYLASVLLVTPFQPGQDATGLPLDQLDVRQQGQALLSTLWALAGVGALVAGLIGDRRALRLGALALLSLTVGKVSLFDLASLTSLYRVGSCIALGLLLLAGAFAWQRLRPRPLPDLRGVPGALR